MTRNEGQTFCEKIMSSVWRTLTQEISLDEEVQLMIQAKMITEGQVTEIKNKEQYKKFDKEDKKRKIVHDILLTIGGKGSKAMHKLLIILKTKGKRTICDKINETLHHKEIECNCEKSEFQEAQDVQNDIQNGNQDEMSYSELVQTVKGMSNELRKLQKSDEEKTNIIAKHEKRHDKHERKNEDLSRKIDELIALVNSLQTQLEKSKGECEILSEENIELKKELANLKIEKEELKKCLQEKTERYSSLQTSMQALKETNEKKQERLVNVNKEKISIEKKLEETQLEITKANAIIMTQGKQIEEAETKMTELKNTLDGSKRKLDQILREKNDNEALLEKTIATLECDLALANNKIENFKKEQKEMKEKLEKSRPAKPSPPPFSTVVKAPHRPLPKKGK